MSGLARIRDRYDVDHLAIPTMGSKVKDDQRRKEWELDFGIEGSVPSSSLAFVAEGETGVSGGRRADAHERGIPS